MSSTPPETAAPAAETSSQPSRGRLTNYDRLVDDLAYNDVVHAADVIVTMGCGDACPISRQALPRLGGRRPQRPAHRQCPRHPRRPASPHHRTAI